MACDWPAQRIELYLGGFLDNSENQAFEEHLLACEACQRYINMKCSAASYSWDGPSSDTIH